MKSTDMLAQSRAAVAAPRERGIVILYAEISSADGYPEIPADP